MDRSQQTEQPTQRRLEKARREGQFPGAREFVAAVQFATMVFLLGAWGGAWMASLRQVTRELLVSAFRPGFSAASLAGATRAVAWRLAAPLALAGALAVGITLLVRMLTTGFGLSLARVAPDFKRLNPATRLREMMRQNIPALGQAVVLLPVFSLAVWGIVRSNLDRYLALPLVDVETGARLVSTSLQDLLWKAAGVFFVIGSVDLLRQRRLHNRDLRMSRQEVRDEAKEMEGNPQIKGRIRKLRRELLRRRMMSQVPTATAVVVNPTHYAVALRYTLASMATPVVVAKGRNYLALRIRQKAIEYQIPVVENPPLAQSLYKVEVGQEIPAHLYRAVAEILAYIYRLTHRRS